MNKNKRPKGSIIAQNKEHTLFKLWSGKVVTKEYIITKIKKGRKYYDLGGAEITFVQQQDKTFLRTIGDNSTKDNLSNVPVTELTLSKNIIHKTVLDNSTKDNLPNVPITELTLSKNIIHKTVSSLNKRRVLTFLIGLLAGVALAIVVIVPIVLTQCKAKNNDKTTPVGVRIDESMATDYLVTGNIYYGSSPTNKMIIGHDLFDLNKYYKDHYLDNPTLFTVDADINFGFLIDPDMANVHINAINNAKVTCNANSNVAASVIIGRNSAPVVRQNWNFNGVLQIDNNTTFTISSLGDACGVFLYSTGTNSAQIINGTFNVSSTNDDAYGVYFNSTANSSVQIINGTFSVSSKLQATGVTIYNTAASVIIINGTFSVSTVTDNAYGVVFGYTQIGSVQIINGTFTVVSSNSLVVGVYFDDTAGSVTINGTFAFSTTQTSYSVDFSSDPATNSTLTMDVTQFFSNKVDSGNIFDKYTGGNQEYKWNDDAMTSSAHSSTSDTGLKLTAIKDDNTTTNFSIWVIDTDGKGGASKAIFNGIYRNELTKYVNSILGQSAGKGWLQAILNKSW